MSGGDLRPEFGWHTRSERTYEKTWTGLERRQKIMVSFSEWIESVWVLYESLPTTLHKMNRRLEFEQFRSLLEQSFSTETPCVDSAVLIVTSLALLPQYPLLSTVTLSDIFDRQRLIRIIKFWTQQKATYVTDPHWYLQITRYLRHFIQVSQQEHRHT